MIAEITTNKSRPNDLLALGDQKTKLLELKLEAGHDPEELADAIAELEIEYRKDVPEEERFATVVRVAGIHPEYSATINNEIRNAKKSGVNVTSEDLLEVLHDQWKIAGKGKAVIVDEPTETSLVKIRGTNYRLVLADAQTERHLLTSKGGKIVVLGLVGSAAEITIAGIVPSVTN